MNLLLGLLAGACLGAIGGLLFAPHKGTVTRRMITRRGGDYVDMLEEKVDDLMVAIDSKIGNVRKEVTDFVKREKVKAHEHSHNGNMR